jgi:DNA-binding NarL/FixJ family response regulator
MPQQPIRPIRIFIVDDHPVVRAGLISMLGTQAELEVVGSAASGEEAFPNSARRSRTCCCLIFGCMG